MLTLDYQLDPIAASKQAGVDLAVAPPETLRYSLFLGNICMRGNGADFSAGWGWVPVLDFALSLKAIAETLGHALAERFEFTESDAALDFRRDGVDVEITSTYAPGILRVPLSELREQARSFSRRVIGELATANIRLAANPEIRRHLGSH
jgi:hypothetical protein